MPYEQKLMLALRHPVRENRMLAIQLLGELRSVAALDALGAILAEEPDYYVIREVARAVARIGTGRGHRLIESLEHHSSPLVRRLAQQLRNRPVPGDQP